jgi:peptide/nickel transport system permease protein
VTISENTRAAVLEVASQDYVMVARAKGLRSRTILGHYLVRNALTPVITVTGLQLASLLGGSILIETVFAWPGTGFLLNSAIFQRDLPLLQGTILVLAMFFVVLNVVVDIVQSLLDPRIARS